MNDLLTSAGSVALSDEAASLAISHVVAKSLRADLECATSARTHSNPASRRKLPRILIETNSAPHEFLHGITRYAREHNWQLVANTLYTGASPKTWDGDGILTLGPVDHGSSDCEVGRFLPRVTVSSTNDCDVVPRVQPDNFSIGRLAAEHLVGRGCRSFAWAPFRDNSHNRERLEGFLSITRGYRYQCSLLPPTPGAFGQARPDAWDDWRAAVATTLASLPKRAGLFAFDDCISVELAELAREAGINVPEDLAIIGVGNQSLVCETAPVPLSSVDPDLERVAYRAAELLAALLEGKTIASETVRVSPKGVVSRESTAFSAQECPRVTQARAFIVENYADPSLSVSAVAEQIGVSRRQLEREFRSSKGCTVREYIEEERMSEASRLLIEQPDVKISAIAERVGVHSCGNFFRIFRKRFGDTPTAYRKRFTNTPTISAR